MRPCLLSFLMFSLIHSTGFGEDKPLAWPQFRGPGGSGIAVDQKPPVEFGPDQNVQWKVPAPSGSSSPIVVGDKLIFTGFEESKLYTLAYSRTDGRELWRAESPVHKLEAFHKTEGSPAASTPATDGKRIVSYFGSCGLFCYDLAGVELWKLEMPAATTMFDFGTGVSPIIADGMVILVRDERNDSKIIAVDLASGVLKWSRKRLSIASHATPVLWETASGKQVVVPGAGRMISYDLQTGDEKWWVNGMPSMCCASPVIGSGKLFLAAWSPGEDTQLPAFDAILEQAEETHLGYLTESGNAKTMMKDFFASHDTNKDGKVSRDEWETILSYMSASQNSALAVKPDGTGDVTKTHVQWRRPKAKGLPYVPSMIFYGGQCVMVKDGGIVTAYRSEDGAEVYMRRAAAPGRYYSSPIAANGYIYFTSLDEGTVTVMKAGGETPEVVVKNELADRIAATPAIADDTLYIRTSRTLYAFKTMKESPSLTRD